MKKLIRNIVDGRFINALLLNTLYKIGLRNQWIKSHFYRIGEFTRQDLKMIGRLWEPVASQVFWGGKYGFESEMSSLFDNDVANDSVVLDIGANEGMVITVASDVEGARSKIRRDLGRNLIPDRVFRTTFFRVPRFLVFPSREAGV